jgi:hypothetical protein
MLVLLYVALIPKALLEIYREIRMQKKRSAGEKERMHEVREFCIVFSTPLVSNEIILRERKIILVRSIQFSSCEEKPCLYCFT